MQTSDLPKLPEHWKRGDSCFSAAVRLMKVQVAEAGRWVQRKTWQDWNFENPLVSVYTTMVMVPVGGSFCCMDVCSAGMVFPACNAQEEYQV